MFKRHSKPLHVASSCVADRDNVQNPIPGARGEGGMNMVGVDLSEDEGSLSEYLRYIVFLPM